MCKKRKIDFVFTIGNLIYGKYSKWIRKNMERTMIPKIIHYCWFGRNPLPPLAQKCIASWKRYLPDYEIKEWNEDNFDVNALAYTKEAYEAKKYAFVSDVARLHAMVTYGGIYMDTDVEVLRSLDCFLENDAFSGFEDDTRISTGIMACKAGFHLFKEFLEEYSNVHFKLDDGSFDITTNVSRITRKCTEKGFIPNNKAQIIDGFKLFPKDYFCPKSPLTLITTLTENTYTIHHFDGSWLTEKDKWKNKFSIFLSKTMPIFIASRIAFLLSICKFDGIKSLFRFLALRILFLLKKIMKNKKYSR